LQRRPSKAALLLMTALRFGMHWREEQKTLGKPNNAAVGPEKTLSRQNFKRNVV